MQEKIIRLTAVYTGIFAVIVILAMILYQMNKPQLMVAESGLQGGVESVVQTLETTGIVHNGELGTALPVTGLTEGNHTFQVVFSEASQKLDESTVSVEMDYVNKYALLSLHNISRKELEECQILADPLVVVSEDIRTTSIEGETEGCIIQIPETVYETCQLEVSQDKISLHFDKLLPSAECTVVIDAGHGGDDIGTGMKELQEKEVSLAVIEQLRSMLEKDGEGMRIFYTRTMDTNASDADRVAFANAIKADMLISLHVNLEPATENGLKAFYNDTYFIPDFGSIELANLMETEVIQKIGGVASGLYPADAGDTLVTEAQVPVVKLEVNSMCTEEDLARLQTPAYQRQMAEGILSGIQKAYEQIQATQS